jgi:hypothetical protein
VCSAPRNKGGGRRPGDIRGAEHTVGVIPPAGASPAIIDPVDQQMLVILNAILKTQQPWRTEPN